MNKPLYALIISFSLIGCNHPEGKKYDRNQGHKKEFSSERDHLNMNAVQSETHNNNRLVNRNILEMELQNGARYVWIEINEIRLRFIFDTGASSICISPAEATVLFRQGSLRKEDILNVEYFQDATGKISEGTKINLREVKIGDVILDNVEALVIDNVNAPLLLGQSVLERFGSIEIDNVNGDIIFK
ncbi:aspartyl protease family protein [Dyadobacter jejuensis]|uniref:Aspartyl protease family protein n=1 Tax=Dyadobacter jejuensis TaxID=1082580 RepID=A0A316AJ99_9BACT|nr:retropepsin-like aspartic protease [Dyadobacter jejuensis]PWJ57309.1 aspartyl protease family protein [Dyadobacter jejuensis]